MSAKVKKKSEEAETKDSSDSPLIDSDVAVRKMIKSATQRGFITASERDKVLTLDKFTSEQIEDILSQLSELGINVIENDDDHDDEDEDSESESLVESQSTAVVKSTKTGTGGDRTDDPVRMYLREMGSVELLSREGEIAIAKRIEAGRETMIAGLCESPLTFQAIIIWRDELNDGKVLLRDIIDLDATFAGPDAKKIDRSAEGAAPPPSGAPTGEAEGVPSDDESDEESNLSISAMENELKPQVLETFDAIASIYQKLRRIQDRKVELKSGNKELTNAQLKKLEEMTSEVIQHVKVLSLNNSRIEALVEQLYMINKRLLMLENQIWRMADKSGVDREEFLKHYQGNEYESGWTRRVSRLTGKGWKNFITCLLYTSPSPRDMRRSRMPSSA